MAGLVENHLHQRVAGLGVLDRQDPGGDFDQIRREPSTVPFLENPGYLKGLHPQTTAHHLVGFRNQLHVAVFDPVVDHLDEVTGATGANVGHTGACIRDRSDLFQH